MAYTVTDTSGNSLTLAQGHKITSIAGQSRELYITEIAPYAQGKRRRARIVAPVSAVIAPFVEVDSGTLAPTYDSSVTVLAQAKTEKSNRYNPKGEDSDADFGPNAPESAEVLYFNNADSTQDFGVIKVRLADAARGLMFPGMFTAQYIPAPSESGGDPDLFIPPTYTPGTPVDLTLSFINLSDQMRYEGGTGVKRGDAVIKFTRDQLTKAQILADKGLFEITPIGGSAISYEVWGSDGVEYEQTYHWCVYLRRVRP